MKALKAFMRKRLDSYNNRRNDPTERRAVRPFAIPPFRSPVVPAGGPGRAEGRCAPGRAGRFHRRTHRPQGAVGQLLFL
ncbi:MAG: hypothetical protein MZV64_71220 [Ignavibacteriales bacterium]|nr:hypothetical protein [Ignavibacteriales bacterium]